VTEFPELQQALVAAARHRRRRVRSVVRPVLIAAAAAAAVIAIVTVAHAPNDEHAAAPPPPTTDRYAVFGRPATKADGLPNAVAGMPGLHVEQARLAARSAPWRVYLVAGTLDQRAVVCAFAVIGDRARYGCDPAGTVHAYAFPPGDGEPGGIVATVPDGIDELEVTFDSAGSGATVTDNAVLIPLDEWPTGHGIVTWKGGEAPLKTP
jgi:hypothetical protein